MRQSERERLRERFGYRCGYCGVSEVDVGAELTIDHFHPKSLGGGDDLDNLVYCCHPCNEFKGNYWQPQSTERVLHPLRDTLPLHIQERGDHVLAGLTPTGAFHVEHLHLNRRHLIEHRRRHAERDAILSTQQEMLRRLEEHEQELHRLREFLEALRTQMQPTND